MRLRKVEWWEVPRKSRLSVLPVHTKETVREVIRETLAEETLAPIKKEIDKLKKRKPEFVGGSGAVGTYHQVTSNEIRFSKHSFNPGINVIGVASGMPTTIWLPQDLEHNHLIAVKDELGVAEQQPITLRVAT